MPSPTSSLTPEPTEQDLANASMRQAIADRQNAAYMEVLELALRTFGPGWLPSCRHDLVDKAEEDRCRHTGERPRPAATVFTVRHEKTGEKRHFTVSGTGEVTEWESYQAAFGSMLFEPHPTQRIEVRGEKVAPHRYSLCWAGFELYYPQSAEELAKRRASREAKKDERERKAWEKERPLLPLMGVTWEDWKKEGEAGKK